MYSKHKSERVRQQGSEKVCRATIVKKRKKLLKKKKCRFVMMLGDPSLNVSENSVVKTDKEQKIEDKHNQYNLSCYRASAFTNVISTVTPDQQA